MTRAIANETVLVYGRDRDARLSLHRVLRAAGFRVLMASSRAEAAKCLAAGAVALLIATDADAAADGKHLRAAGDQVPAAQPYMNMLDLAAVAVSATPIHVLALVRAALPG